MGAPADGPAESGTTIFLTTHYLEEAEQADRICIIDGGRIVAEGTPATLKADLSGEYLVVDADDRGQLRLELERLDLRPTGEGPFPIPVDGRGTHATLKAIDTPLTLVRTHVADPRGRLPGDRRARRGFRR